MAKKTKSHRIHAVDLFCGIGGLTHGLSLSGIKIKAGLDIDASCRYAYEANNRGARFLAADIQQVGFEDIAPYYRGTDVTAMACCAPCQPFSAHVRKTPGPKADSYALVSAFARLIKEGSPDLISMENVPDLAKHRTFDDLLKTLDALGYRFEYDILSCVAYGIPQKRKRLVLLASKLGGIALPGPTGETTTVADVIQDLPPIDDGQASKGDPCQVTLALSKQNHRRIRRSKPGGSWRDWDDDMINPCHRKAYYPASYGRMRWDAPAPTITTQFCYYSTGRFGHPEQRRVISVREAALLQTFPRKYKFSEGCKPFVIHKVARQIGNAVPVKLAQAIGQSLMEGAHA